MSLSHVVAYITGAGQGLGKATAIYLASKGAKICLVDVVKDNVTKVEETIGTLNAITLVLNLICC